MPKKARKARKPAKQPETGIPTGRLGRSGCTMPIVPERQFSAEVEPFRAQLIRENSKKWVNGTVLHYYFFDRPTDGNGRWVGPKAQRDVVRKAFKAWKDLGIGLVFAEVQNREDAEVRIGFDQSDGSWSYIGRDIIDHVKDPNKRTMNFGWDLTTAYGWDTALHEIGHTLGFPHEHQNPNAGIVWNEPAVYSYFRGSPNFWNDQTIEWNILRKYSVGSVSGSSWDPNSIMHYDFPKGLIDQPVQYRNGLMPAPGLTAVDVNQVKTFYPPPPKQKEPELSPFASQRLRLKPGQQINLRIRPPMTRRYSIQTFGTSDAVMVLFEDAAGGPRYVAGEDDSGSNRNAQIKTKLYRGREYILRVRLFYAEAEGEMAVLLW